MDFAKFKSKLGELKDKAVEFKDKTVENTAKKISESTLVLVNQQSFEEFIQKSENKKFTSKEWVEKTFVKRVFILIWDSKKDFFKDLIVSLPILYTKAYSQSLLFKVVDISTGNIDYSKYEIKDFPSILVFENKELYKIIAGEENVKKVVKTLSLDINKTIDEIE